jgi:hypothetical protein
VGIKRQGAWTPASDSRSKFGPSPRAPVGAGRSGTRFEAKSLKAVGPATGLPTILAKRRSRLDSCGSPSSTLPFRPEGFHLLQGPDDRGSRRRAGLWGDDDVGRESARPTMAVEACPLVRPMVWTKVEAAPHGSPAVPGRECVSSRPRRGCGGGGDETEAGPGPSGSLRRRRRVDLPGGVGVGRSQRIERRRFPEARTAVRYRSSLTILCQIRSMASRSSGRAR